MRSYGMVDDGWTVTTKFIKYSKQTHLTEAYQSLLEVHQKHPFYILKHGLFPVAPF